MKINFKYPLPHGAAARANLNPRAPRSCAEPLGPATRQPSSGVRRPAGAEERAMQPRGGRLDTLRREILAPPGRVPCIPPAAKQRMRQSDTFIQTTQRGHRSSPSGRERRCATSWAVRIPRVPRRAQHPWRRSCGDVRLPFGRAARMALILQETNAAACRLGNETSGDGACRVAELKAPRPSRRPR